MFLRIREQGKIPAGATLLFDCELLGFGPKKKEKWEYTDDEKVQFIMIQ